MNVNYVIIAGNLTRDPELKYLPNGTAVCELAIALNRRWTDKQTNERKEEVSYIDISAFGRTGELAAEYLKKGRSAIIEGSLKQERWETQHGDKRSRVRVIARAVHFTPGKKKGGDGDQEPLVVPDDIAF